jgi:hypothetical protein
VKFDVIEGNGRVRALVIENICPYCGKTTAMNLGHAILGRFASQVAEQGELVCYHCENPDCEHANYYVRMVDVEDCAY